MPFLFTQLLRENFGLGFMEKTLKKKKKREKENLGIWSRGGCVGGGKGKKKYLALVRNGGLNHLLKIFNDISVFLV